MALTLHRPAAFARTILGACIVYAVLTAGGCAKREPIRPTFGMSEPSDQWMRVLLFHNRTECVISAPGGIGVRDEANTVQVRFSSEPMRIFADGQRICINSLYLDSTLIFEPADPFVFFIDGRGYRGNLKMNVDEPNSLRAINIVPIEAYLAGVVGAEMYSYWEPQALQAQAIAARTYALYAKKRFGKDRDWDMTTTQANQVYRGLSAETATVRDAVERTRGMILICSNESSGQDIFPTYYSSTCGGHTEDSQAVFGESFLPLQPIECPWCNLIAKNSLRNWGPVEYSIEEIHCRLTARYPSLIEKLGKVSAVEITRNGSFGRVTGVTILGNNGKKDFLRGEDFRLALDPSGKKLKSTVFSLRREGIVYVFFDGHGFGHGVGLCQTGAEYLAREGRTYREILSWYYPGSTIIRLSELQ